MDCNVFCGTCWSKMTRLLNTAIIGATVEIVTSSRVDMLAGLSRWAIRSSPPCVWAHAASEAEIEISKPAAAVRKRKSRLIFLPDFCRPGSLAKPAPNLATLCPAQLSFKVPTSVRIPR